MENLLNHFLSLNPLLQALLAGLFTWFMTSLGAASIFIKKNISRRTNDIMLGFAAGIMTAATFFSMLIPAIAMSKGDPLIPQWFPAVVGLIIGFVSFRFVDILVPHLHPSLKATEPEGPKTNWKQSILLTLAVTIHNIPEGIAIGIAFGATAIMGISALPALTLALGIGIQDAPEGLAISLPLRRCGLSRIKSFMYGSMSGIVEPVFAVIGALSVVFMKSILPYALAFAAGAMLFIVVEELIPESQSSDHGDMATMGFMAGFALMMMLEIMFAV